MVKHKMCCIRADYEILCEQFATAYHGQIGKANCNFEKLWIAGNVIDVYILAHGDGADD